ncbi:MAG: hypothetical protein QXZ63_06675 [Sulfolobales archaeon]
MSWDDDGVWRDTSMFRDFVRAEREADVYDRFYTTVSWSLDKRGEEKPGSGPGGLKTVKERVEYILEHYPETRNSDFLLIIVYLRLFTPLGKFIKYIPYRLIKKFEGLFETIRRCRQLIQAEGRYLPTDPKVLEARKKKERRLRKLLGGRDL